MTIETALASIGCPVVHAPYTGGAATFVAFHLVIEEGVLHADGDEQAGERVYSVDYFSNSDWRYAVASIKATLKAAGYSVQSIGPEIFETDTKLYHIPILVSEDT